MNDFGFHAILSSPVIGYLELAKLLIAKKVPYIQIRMKEAQPDELRKIAIAIELLCKGTTTRLILHDEPALAAEIGAKGVHLSRKGPVYKEARAWLGPEAIIGLSCLKAEHVQEANLLQPDYIGLGPAFSIPENPDTPIGLNGLAEMLAITTIPALAIGGITTENLAEVKRTGAKNVTVIRELNDSPCPAEVLERIRGVYTW